MSSPKVDPDEREARLMKAAELSGAAGSTDFQEHVARVRMVLSRAVLATGLGPGLFVDEEDRIEARWTVGEPPQSARIVNVSFGNTIEVYVYDRSVGEVTYEATFAVDEPAVAGDVIANIVQSTVDGVSNSPGGI